MQRSDLSIALVSLAIACLGGAIAVQGAEIPPVRARIQVARKIRINACLIVLKLALTAAHPIPFLISALGRTDRSAGN